MYSIFLHQFITTNYLFRSSKGNMSEHIVCNEFKSFNMKADLHIGWTQKHTSRLYMADKYSL